jgi:two-component system, OmpR family, sensor kinase
MTLRTRLLAGFVLVLSVVVGAGFAVAYLQRDYLIGQLDEQLEAVVPNARVVIGREGGRQPGGPRNAPLAMTALTDAYVGVIDEGGVLTTYVTPSDDPFLVPDLGTPRVITAPITVDTLSGEADRVRLVSVPLQPIRDRGLLMVVALPTTRAEEAYRSLLLTTAIAALVVAAVLGLVAWWVNQLGLRPIRQMTEAADAIAAGATDTRVEVMPGRHEAARLGQALNVMIDTNQESEARLRRFVADASHELRTPLTTLRGYAELSAAGGLDTPDERADVMRRINQEATRMGRMVDDLLLLAELDEQRPMEREPVDLVALVRDLAADMAVVQPDRPVDVVAPSTPVVITADRDRITQAVTALTTNAMRHTPVSAPVVLRVHDEGDAVRIEVADQGPGIPPEAVPHLFERFYRADPSRARASGGNGLGLAIVSRIVEAHGGRCGVSSQLGQGSTFWVTLPRGDASVR